MKRRIYSESFVDRQIAKINAMNEKNHNIIDCPQFLLDASQPYDWRYSTGNGISARDIEQLKSYIQQWKDISYVSGFWAGYTLRNGIAD